MASLLNNASLLLNPAGSIIAYEEDKILSVLPSNGTGDFTFSGGDGGTRVNQQGYVEQTPANLMTYSEVVSNWTGNLFNNWIVCAVTSDIVVAPNGTLTGDRIGNGYGSFNQSAPATPGQTYTYSVYLKNVSLSASFYVYVAWGLNGSLVSYSTAGAQINVSTLSTTEWTRLTFTATAPSSGINQMQFGPCPFTGYGTNPSGQQLDVWGGMINIGSTAKPYQPTTDRLNYPRITYQNGRGALLSEPQRTNLALQSNIFPSVNYPSNVNGYYYYSAATLNSTNNLSPDGTNNAYNITMHNVVYDMYSTFTGLSVGTTYSYSVYVKLGSATNFSVVVNNTVAWNSVAGSQTFTNLNGTNYTRVSITFVAPVQGQVNIHLGGHAENITQQSPGDVYIWGEQFEVGTYPTSYIPTTSATVTRPGDVTTKTGASSVINASEGTIYVDFVFGDNDTGGSDQNLTMLYSGGYSNSVFFACYGSTIKKLYGWITNGATQVAIQSPTLYKGQRVKAALTYKNNDYIMYVNGVSAGTQAQPVPSLDTIIVGNQIGGTAQAPNPLATTALFNTRLTNTQLAELTTVRSGSGGNISYYGPYTIHTFTGSATFTPSFTGPVEVLVVAGGGGGGVDRAGAGGAGGLLYVSSYGVSAGTGVTVTVGAGGTGTGQNVVGGQGSNSVFGGLTSIGGGGGGTGAGVAGANGGSGGGGGNGGAGGTTPGGLGIISQGNNGGSGTYTGPNYGTGGGGGAGTPGVNGTNVSSGNGGDGLPYSISGFSIYYAGGGGAGSYGGGTNGVGGLGGGGNGFQSAANSGINYTGGGGGSAGNIISQGGTGGSGIVIVRYLT